MVDSGGMGLAEHAVDFVGDGSVVEGLKAGCDLEGTRSDSLLPRYT